MTTHEVSNITVGKPQVHPAKLGHVKGIKEGNARGNLRRSKGFKKERGRQAKGTAARSTGINAKARNPILKGMPNLSPP
jgi:hypothetical protein